MRILFLSILVLIGGCARGPIKNRQDSLRLTASFPSLHDDLDTTSLKTALESTLRIHKAKPDKTDDAINFGPRRVSRSVYIARLERLLAALKDDATGELFRLALRNDFEVFEVYGQESWGEVFITSYFEPVINGAAKKTAQFTQPLYGLPKDLVTVDLSSFKTALPEPRASHGLTPRLLRGRLVEPTEKDHTPTVAAYDDRSQIDSKGLKDRASVLAWVDPIDGFFLEIQGSGVVKLNAGKELRVGYASQNGHPYSAIGKYLFDVIPKEKMTQQTIEAHLRSLPEPEARKLMQQNPSFVFFRPLENRGITAFGSEVVSGRTIATDPTYFPKGTLAFLEFSKPVFESPAATEPTAWQPTSRFVFDHDTGGAIRGPHRVDLFWGQGPEAKQAAGVMKGQGRLVYFVPKEDSRL